MLGGLYGDLPPPSSADEEKTSNSAVWSTSANFSVSGLCKISSSLFFTPPVMRSQTKPKTPNLGQTSTKPVVSPDKSVRKPPVVVNQQPALVGVTSNVIEEYDPARPNAYEEYRREKKRKAVEAEMNKEIERRRQEEEEREREREQRQREANESSARPASLNISGEEAWKRRAAMSGGGSAPRSPSPPAKGDGGFSIGKSGSVGLGVGAGGQMTAAQKMMAKMGWKQGQGLGKQEQGITTPLMAKKTDKRAGVIVNASEPKSEKKPKSVNINGAPTRVLLLRNMVFMYFNTFFDQLSTRGWFNFYIMVSYNDGICKIA
ncbi:hypothetical protein MKW94_008280 [Papaver nudicaule]|uniref:G-patch domain-containing protein n=1 Tax=Papaver nudicaule TaxID=74823 RepID=A0AA42B0U0_PAPNU|nr:hypothetical protein [Papaver nudicaule]